MARFDISSCSGPATVATRPQGVVLLVEDEPSVRTVTRRMLQVRGFTVLLAETPEDALHVAARASHLDLLLTDVQLPGMDGQELANRIRVERPNLKVVFISGYAREDAFLHGTDSGADEFIQKPFTQAQLAAVLAHALSSGAEDDTKS